MVRKCRQRVCDRRLLSSTGRRSADEHARILLVEAASRPERASRVPEGLLHAKCARVRNARNGSGGWETARSK